MTDTSTIIQQAERYIRQLLADQLSTDYVFHNYDHAQEVAGQCEDLAEAAELSEEETEDLILAGWFHDVGYIDGEDGHEKRSAEIASNFLSDKTHPRDRIDRIEKLILSTHPDKSPEEDLEKLLHDATWSFLGRKRFFRRGELLLLERETVSGKKQSLEKNDKELLELILSERFLTASGRDEYATRKNKNIAKQRNNIVKSQKKTVRRKTGKDFGRGVDTLYRTTLSRW